MERDDSFDWGFAKVAAIVGALLVVSAVVHRATFGTPLYTSLPIRYVELVCVVVLILLLGEQPLAAVVRLVQRRWSALRAIGVTLLVSVIALIAGFAIDPATLLYAT